MTTVVTAEDLRAECLKERYRRLLAKPEVFPSDANWSYIIERRMDGIGPGLYRKYLVAFLTPERERCDFHLLALSRFPEWVRVVSREYALDVVYGDIKSSPEATLELVRNCELFDAGKLCDVLQDPSQRVFVVEAMAAFQPEYDSAALEDMKMLRKMVGELPPTGSIKGARALFKSSTRFVCANGHDNDSEEEFCNRCGINILGFDERQMGIIDEFDRRIDALARLLYKY